MLRRSWLLILFLIFTNSAHAFFYRAANMSEYCQAYLQYEQVDPKVDEYNAGICAGYMASKLEFLQLTDRLCNEDPPNLDDVIRGYIEFINMHPELADKSSLRTVVQYLDKQYTCDKDGPPEQ